MQNYVRLIFANANRTILTQHIIQIKVVIVSIFAPFNFAVLLSFWNSWNKGHKNIKGFTVSGHARYQIPTNTYT